MRKHRKYFKDLKVRDNVFVVNHQLEIKPIEIRSLHVEGNSLIINYEARGYWFNERGGPAALPLDSQWKMNWTPKEYAASGALFTLESDARRYCKTKWREVFDNLYKTAKTAVSAIRSYREQHSEGLNHLWRESEIEALERELR